MQTDSTALAPAPGIPKSGRYDGSRTSLAIHSKVIALRVAGWPITHIAKELGISPNTAKGIVRRCAIDDAVQWMHASLVRSYGDAAVKTVGKAVRTDVDAAFRLLEGIGVLGARPGTSGQGAALTSIHNSINVIAKDVPHAQVIDNTPVTSTDGIPDTIQAAANPAARTIEIHSGIKNFSGEPNEETGTAAPPAADYPDEG